MTGAPSLAETAIHAYIYGYPLVLADMHRRVTTNRPGRGGRGIAAPANTLARAVGVEEAGDFAIAMTANTAGWLDLRDGPVRLHVPETRRRFAFVTLFDGFGIPFASLGTREGGSRDRVYLIRGPSHTNEDAAGVPAVDSPGAWVFALARTWPAVNDERGPRSRRFHVIPERAYMPERDPTIDPRIGARAQVERMSAEEYWQAVADLLQIHPAPKQDWKMLIALAALGIRPGHPVDLRKIDELTRGSLRRALPLALTRISDAADRLAVGREIVTEDPYLRRAARAQLGFAREFPQDIYEAVCYHDEAGQALDGRRDYDIILSEADVPRTGAFWTLDIYDIAHPRNLPSHSVHGESLELRDDGSVHLAFGPNASSRSANAFEGLPQQYLITVRTYIPAFAMLDAGWHVPAPRVVDTNGTLASFN